MAKITIYEQDVTTAGSTNVTDNIVYVPGYAIMGPVNTPTLCNTLEEFKNLFGASPYVFKAPETNYGIKKGDYEKGYIYATELLNAGLPVLFERCNTVEFAKSSRASRSFGIYSIEYVYSVEQSTNAFSLELEPAKDTLTYTIPFPNADNAIYGVKDGSIVVELSAGTDGSALYRIKSKEVEGVITYVAYLVSEGKETETTNIHTIEYAGGALTFTLISEIVGEVNVSYELKETVTWTARCIYNKGYEASLWASSTTASLYKIEDADVTATEIQNGINLAFTTPINTEYKGVATPVKSSTSIGNIVVSAKYAGQYGEDIKVTSFKANDVDSAYFDMEITSVLNGTTNVERHTFSLDNNDKKYFVKNISSNIITFEDSEIEPNMTNANMYYVSTLVDGETAQLVLPNATSGDEFRVSDMYTKYLTSADRWTDLADRGEYNFKFLTTGGYSLYSSNAESSENAIISLAMQCAVDRADCVVLIDAMDTENDTPNDIYTNIQAKGTNALPIVKGSITGEDARKYAAMIVPSAKYNIKTLPNLVLDMPGSFAYLKCLATSTKTNANWYAISGVTRGLVPDLVALNHKLTGAMAERLQSRTGISINPITNINPYGYCIWGNRTLFNNVTDLTASSFLNIRLLSSDIKKVVYQASKSLTFELNSDDLWLKFRAAIEPTLDQMVTGNGLSGYKLIRVNSPKKATVSCIVRLFAIEAVEDWDITIELADNYVSVL